VKVNTVIQGDCLEVMQGIPDGSIDSVITDPPYGLSFMGAKWDYQIPSVEIWKEVLRVAKPGSTLLCFAGTRTQHRMAVNIEDAGWVLKDCIMWLYGSGFPKSHNVSKAMKKQGLAPELWDGYGTALKPAYEPIIVAMKPNDGTYVDNALRHGVAGVNIDGGRISHNEEVIYTHRTAPKSSGHKMGKFKKNGVLASPSPQGRFPANIILDEEAGRMLDEQTGNNESRFFYCAKASKAERDAGLDELPDHNGGSYEFRQDGSLDGVIPVKKNIHPTVKPIALMEYLCKLTRTPMGGVVLDPFAGSGGTGVACVNTGRDFILMELDPVHCDIAERRVLYARGRLPDQRELF